MEIASNNILCNITQNILFPTIHYYNIIYDKYYIYI